MKIIAGNEKGLVIRIDLKKYLLYDIKNKKITMPVATTPEVFYRSGHFGPYEAGQEDYEDVRVALEDFRCNSCGIMLNWDWDKLLS